MIDKLFQFLKDLFKSILQHGKDNDKENIKSCLDTYYDYNIYTENELIDYIDYDYLRNFKGFRFLLNCVNLKTHLQIGKAN